MWDTEHSVYTNQHNLAIYNHKGFSNGCFYTLHLLRQQTPLFEHEIVI